MFSRLLFSLSVTFFLFLLLQCFNHAVDGRITVILTHLGQRLQRVLQMDGLGMWYQFIEDLRTIGQLLIVVAILIKQTDSLAIATTCITKVLTCPVKVA